MPPIGNDLKQSLQTFNKPLARVKSTRSCQINSLFATFSHDSVPMVLAGFAPNRSSRTCGFRTVASWTRFWEMIGEHLPLYLPVITVQFICNQRHQDVKNAKADFGPVVPRWAPGPGSRPTPQLADGYGTKIHPLGTQREVACRQDC